MNHSNVTEKSTAFLNFFGSSIKMSFQLSGNRLGINSLSSTLIIPPVAAYSFLFSK